MRRLRIYQVDAFTGRLFGGNPAAGTLTVVAAGARDGR